jgi:very-short-patch-repair endonuclease
MAKIDMMNKVCGMLTVIDSAPNNKRGDAMWKCKCERGNMVIVKGAHLRSGNSTSCGCKRTAKIIEANQKRMKDLTNQTFEELTALYPNGRNNNKSIVWHCKCSCGNETDVSSHDLITGNTKSCGCKRNQSYGEQKIMELLDKAGIKYIREYTPSTLSFKGRFDFYLSELNIIIEYDGIQHFKSGTGAYDNPEKFNLTQEHDRIKTEWCLENNITLIRIPYTKYTTLCIEDLIPQKEK